MNDNTLTACLFIVGSYLVARGVSWVWVRRVHRARERRRTALVEASGGSMPRRPLPAYTLGGFRLPVYVRQRS